jgi:hypothetical protein
MRAFKLILLLLVLGVGDSAHALDDLPVPPVGGTCVPDSATIRAGHYETAGFGVRFSGVSIGRIRLFCPLNTVVSQDDILFGGAWMSVIDEDGTEARGRIQAHLRRAVVGTNIWIEIGRCDSASTATNTASTGTPQRLSSTFHPLYKPKGTEWYWWDVEIERTTPSVNVEFLGIEIAWARN